MTEDPIHKHNGKWYFWDELWAFRCGPFDTKDECKQKLNRYCREHLGMTEEKKQKVNE